MKGEIKRILFLDDDANRHLIFIERMKELAPKALVRQAWTAKEAIEILENEERFDVVSLDHDLDLTSTLIEPSLMEELRGHNWREYWEKREKEVGFVVAMHIFLRLAEDKLPELVVIHSVNRAGSARMFAVIDKRMPGKVALRPFQYPVGYWSEHDGYIDFGDRTIQDLTVYTDKEGFI